MVATRPPHIVRGAGLIVARPQSAHGKLGNEDSSTDSCESACQFDRDIMHSSMSVIHEMLEVLKTANSTR